MPRPTAEQAIISRSPDGVREHDMGTGWTVIVAKSGEKHATWYYHNADDPRIGQALRKEADRRYAMWAHLAKHAGGDNG